MTFAILSHVLPEKGGSFYATTGAGLQRMMGVCGCLQQSVAQRAFMISAEGIDLDAFMSNIVGRKPPFANDNDRS